MCCSVPGEKGLTEEQNIAWYSFSVTYISIQNCSSQKLTLLLPAFIHVKLHNIGPVSIINYFSFAIENFLCRNFLVPHSIMSFLARKFRLQKHFFMPLLEERQSQNHSLYRATDGFCCVSKKVIQVLIRTKYFFFLDKIRRARPGNFQQPNDTNCGAHLPSSGRRFCHITLQLWCSTKQMSEIRKLPFPDPGSSLEQKHCRQPSEGTHTSLPSKIL